MERVTPQVEQFSPQAAEEFAFSSSLCSALAGFRLTCVQQACGVFWSAFLVIQPSIEASSERAKNNQRFSGNPGAWGGEESAGAAVGTAMLEPQD
jgi:hypothetical protein